MIGGGHYVCFRLLIGPLSIPTQLAHISEPKSLSLHGRVGSETPETFSSIDSGEEFNPSRLCIYVARIVHRFITLVICQSFVITSSALRLSLRNRVFSVHTWSLLPALLFHFGIPVGRTLPSYPSILSNNEYGMYLSTIFPFIPLYVSL